MRDKGEGKAEYSFASMRQIPLLEAGIKEALRLHPPLIILMRLVREDFTIGMRLSGRPADRGIAGSQQPPLARGLPRRGFVRSLSLHRPAPGRHHQPVDLDPVRCRTPPLRRRAVRDDADEGDLLGAAAELRVRAGAGSIPTTTTTRRWSSSWRNRAGCATAAGSRTEAEGD